MAKFKVGDKVKIVGNSSGHMFEIGEAVYILKCNRSNYSAGRCRIDNAPFDWWFVGKDDIVPFNSTAKVV